MIVDWPVVFTGIKTILDPLAQASRPIAASVVAYCFREPITKLITQVKTVSGFGASLDIAQKQDLIAKQGDGAESPAMPPITDPKAAPAPDPVLDILDKSSLDALDAAIGEERLKLLWAVRRGSISEANRLHEMHYRVMFGSQIYALRSLNETFQAEVSVFEHFYNEKVLADPANATIHQGRSFEDWGNFLVNIGYVQLVEDVEPPQVRITPFGRQFCTWLAVSGASTIRPG